MNFETLQLHPTLLKNVRAAGYTSPTPIQEQAIPQVLQRRDLFGCAQTGTGKTAAFALPILQLLQERPEKDHAIRALILTPTRELAIQIFDNFRMYGKGLPQRCCVIFGGVGQAAQVEALQRGVDILVATPGRLNDLIGQGYIDLSQLSIFVLDEADRMLDMGFIHDVERVIEKLPEKRQNLMFSATLPKEIQGLVDSILQDPVKISVTPPATTVEAIDQSVYYVDKENKTKLLLWVLRDPRIASALVFTRTKHGADRVVRELTRAGVPAAAIHGNKSQNARQAALRQFKNHQVRVLVATDIAARGIDIDELSHVINFDIPEVPETYVHRIGRTARAGHSGTAISFCTIDEKADFQQICKLIRKEVPEVTGHPYPMQNRTPMTKEELHQKQLARQQAARKARQRRRMQQDAKHPAAPNHAASQKPDRRQQKSKTQQTAPKAGPQAMARPLPKQKAAPARVHTGTGRKRPAVSKQPQRRPRPDLEKYMPKPLRSRPVDQPLKRHL